MALEELFPFANMTLGFTLVAIYNLVALRRPGQQDQTPSTAGLIAIFSITIVASYWSEENSYLSAAALSGGLAVALLIALLGGLFSAHYWQLFIVWTALSFQLVDQLLHTLTPASPVRSDLIYIDIASLALLLSAAVWVFSRPNVVEGFNRFAEQLDNRVHHKH